VTVPPHPPAKAGLSPAAARFLRITRAPTDAAIVRTDVARHLVLAYRPGWQSLADLNDIRRHVTDIDPTIETFIVPSTARNSVSRRHAATRPTLVVSNGRIIDFRPRRGKVYQGFPIPKSEELRRLAAARVPIPRTAILTPDLRLDEAEWGEFVLVKPSDIATSSHGRGFQLMRTRRVRFIHPRHYPADHPGRLGPMIVQQFIDTGEHLRSYRVLTFFGEPISALVHTSKAKRVDLAAPDAEIEKATVAIQTGGARDSEFMDEPDILAMARRAHEALPEIPLKGCDILRDGKTDALYVIELNCGGNTWHFSSDFMAERRKKYGEEFELRRRQQFDALRTAARILVERTNAEAE
jgi:hypothetical protein